MLIDPTKLISHRGESEDAPENTLPAYRMAVERGFGFECDVYLSKDLRVFTFHDSNLSRTTDGASDKPCAEVTWDEVRRLDVGGWGKWKGSAFTGTRPALLEEVLQLAVDGRQKEWSLGATGSETAQILLAAGASDAINFDGGGSTSLLYWDAKNHKPVVTNRHTIGGYMRPVGSNVGVVIKR